LLLYPIGVTTIICVAIRLTIRQRLKRNRQFWENVLFLKLPLAPKSKRLMAKFLSSKLNHLSDDERRQFMEEARKRCLIK